MPKRKKERTEKHDCPQCLKPQLKRTAAGVWECQSCGHTRAGGAYKPETGAETMLRRALRDEGEVAELEQAKEAVEE